MIAWKLKNVKEIESIFSKYVVGLSKEQFFNILKFVYRTPYDFSYINMDEPWDTMYHRNFNKLKIGWCANKMYVYVYNEIKTYP